MLTHRQFGENGKLTYKHTKDFLKELQGACKLDTKVEGIMVSTIGINGNSIL